MRNTEDRITFRVFIVREHLPSCFRRASVIPFALVQAIRGEDNRYEHERGPVSAFAEQQKYSEAKLTVEYQVKVE